MYHIFHETLNHHSRVPVKGSVFIPLAAFGLQRRQSGLPSFLHGMTAFQRVVLHDNAPPETAARFIYSQSPRKKGGPPLPPFFPFRPLFPPFSLLSALPPCCMPCCRCPSERASWSCLRPIFPGRRQNFVQAFKAKETEKGTLRDLKD